VIQFKYHDYLWKGAELPGTLNANESVGSYSIEAGAVFNTAYIAEKGYTSGMAAT
jgi:hypothetical protein